MSVPARLKSHGESGENLSQPPRPPPRPPVSNMAPRSRRTYHSADPFNQLLNHRSTTDRAEIRAIEKDEDEDGFDTDSEEMSLAVVMKLSNDMTLLKNYLKIYQKFNQRIGGKSYYYAFEKKSRSLCTCTHEAVILIAITQVTLLAKGIRALSDSSLIR